MHSWVFRNRVRLRAIYGPDAPGPLPFQMEEEPAPAPPPSATRARKAGLVERRSRYVILHPMRKKSA